MKKTPRERAFPHLLSEGAIIRMRERGVHVTDKPFFPEQHVAYPYGYIVIKPVAAGGNSIPGHISHFTDIKGTDSHSDMPAIKLYKEGLNWKISVHEYAPGPGPGDFDLVCGMEDQAVNEILHYFFDQN